MGGLKTVVFQSYRTHDVPAWIERCMASVKDWATLRGHDYCFTGDDFLGLAPDWYRAKAGSELCPVTDLCRLIRARQLLAGEHDLAIWIDADLLVFQPEALHLALDEGYAFTHEVWIAPDPAGRVTASHRVNNSIAMFARRQPQLDFFIDACLRIARAQPVLGKLDVGTRFLGNLRRVLPFPLIEGVATLSPLLMHGIAQGATRHSALLAREHAHPIAGANLCGSLELRNPGSADDSLYDRVIERLLAGRGDVFKHNDTAHARRA